MKEFMDIYYDKEGDFLEISIGKPSKCLAEEVQPGIFVRFDKKTKEIRSVGILSFNKRSNLSDLKLRLPGKIEFSEVK